MDMTEKRRLLIIDDDPGVVDIVCRVANEMEFDVHSTNGRQTENVYKEFAPDVIILDILMPEIDGFEVLQMLEAQQNKARVIILSGSPDSYRKIAQSLGTAINISIAGNIRKPFRINELRTILKEIKNSLDDADIRLKA